LLLLLLLLMPRLQAPRSCRRSLAAAQAQQASADAHALELQQQLAAAQAHAKSLEQQLAAAQAELQVAAARKQGVWS
jgi:hypothetical protein